MTPFRAYADAICTTTVTIAVVLLTGIHLSGLLRHPLSAMDGVGNLEDWDSEVAAGIRMGPENARVVIFELMDFTCPYCRALAPVLDSLSVLYPADLALVVQHYPINHQQSIPAAIAAECAVRQGKFNEMYRVLFAAADSLGIEPWRMLAEAAGVPNLLDFEGCVELPVDSFPRIAHGRELATLTRAPGTPTVWVNGKPVKGRDLAALEAVTRNILGL